MIERMKYKFIFAFLIVDIGSIPFYLGLKIDQNQEIRMIKLF